MVYLNDLIKSNKCNNNDIDNFLTLSSSVPLDYEYIPQTQDEFLSVIQNAPTNILIGMGFKKWSKMNDLIIENQIYLNRIDNEHLIIDPIIKEELLSLPSELLVTDVDVILIPSNWCYLIPINFLVTGLFGESISFHENICNEAQFGCLPFGILKNI